MRASYKTYHHTIINSGTATLGYTIWTSNFLRIIHFPQKSSIFPISKIFPQHSFKNYSIVSLSLTFHNIETAQKNDYTRDKCLNSPQVRPSTKKANYPRRYSPKPADHYDPYLVKSCFIRKIISKTDPAASPQPDPNIMSINNVLCLRASQYGSLSRMRECSNLRWIQNAQN